LTTGSGALKFASGGAQFGVSYEAFSLVGEWLDSFVRTISGLDYSGLATGPRAYNEGRIGTDYLAQSSARTESFGRPLSDDEVTQSQSAAVQNLVSSYNNGGVFERYFALSNPFSLSSSLIAEVPSSASGLASMIQSAVPSFLQRIGSIFGQLPNIFSLFSTTGRAAAATSSLSLYQSYQYVGVQQWGWSLKELQTLLGDPAYTLDANTKYVESTQNYQRLSDAYADCYHSGFQNIPGDSSTTPDKCTSNYLSTSDALHWRKYELDRYITGQLSGDVINPSVPPVD